MNLCFICKQLPPVVMGMCQDHYEEFAEWADERAAIMIANGMPEQEAIEAANEAALAGVKENWLRRGK